MTLAGLKLTRTLRTGEVARVAIFYAVIALIHLLGWGMLISSAPSNPALLGLGVLAYSFGLRHAFDADHISAIDNTTRKLLQDGGKPVGIGFFFSLGHSTVVLLISLAIGFAVTAIVDGVLNGHLSDRVALIGTGVSGVFLLLIGILNLVILLDIVAVYRQMRQGQYNSTMLEERLVTGGVLARLFSRLFKLISHSWQMYFIGFLFGLGFDTASEVALLAISAGAATQGLPVTAIVSLPLIFAAGMSLADTTDGIFMAKAYSWAFSNPVRKLFYNLTMTGLSVFVAFFIGGTEIVQILSQSLGLNEGVWGVINELDLGRLGFIIVGAFVVAWAISLSLFKLRRVEERWTGLVERPH